MRCKVCHKILVTDNEKKQGLCSIHASAKHDVKKKGFWGIMAVLGVAVWAKRDKLKKSVSIIKLLLRY
jgi:hypothetical protein